MRGIGLGLGLALHRGTGTPMPVPIVDYQWTAFTGVIEPAGADWTSNDVGVDPNVTTITDSSGALGRNDRMFELATTALHYISASATLVNGTTYTIALIVKPASTSRNVLYLNTYDAGQAYVAVNLATQVVIDHLNASAISVTAVGNGYYRVQFDFVSGGGAHGIDIFAALDDGTLVYAGIADNNHAFILESLTISHEAP